MEEPMHHVPARQPSSEAAREKRAVALSSVLAAVALTGTKIAVGVWTNSLGLLSEAAHSGLDLIAAAVTFWAVSAASRPADRDHTYGHGKIENLSALFETLLLLLTCGWIIWESTARLLFKEVHVAVNAWSFVVVVFSVAVDYSRSRALMRMAKKHQSQALEADALHFSTDIWSSLVVLFGLAGVVAAGRLGLPWLAKADAVAALGVAVIVVSICWRLGKKSVDDLMDAVPADLRDRIASAAQIAGVAEVRHVRARRSGPTLFIELTVGVHRGTCLERAHDISDKIEEAVQRLVGEADVLVHIEPCGDLTDPLSVVRSAAARRGLAAHSLRIYDEQGSRTLEYHLEVGAGMSLDAAHELASAVEDDLRRALPDTTRVVSHIEPASDSPQSAEAATEHERRVRAALGRFAAMEKVSFTPREVRIRACDGRLSVTMRCALSAVADVGAAHEFTARIESYLRAHVSGIDRVTVHTEPHGAA